MEALLQTIIDESWQYNLENNPIEATFYGDHRYNDSLPVFTLKAIKQKNKKIEFFLAELKKLDYDQLNPTSKINHQILKRQFSDQINEFTFKMHFMPLSQVHGFHIYLPELPHYTRFSTQKDYEMYILRLEKIPAYVQQHIDIMRMGLKEGHTIPKIALSTFQKGIEEQAKQEVRPSSFFQPFNNVPKALDCHKKIWQEKGTVAIKEIYESYAKFSQFLKEEYMPKSRDEVGISILPNGKAFYEFLVESQTTLNITPQEIHDIGIEEVGRIEKEILAVLEKVNFKGDLKEFKEFLQSNEDFYAKTEKQLLLEVSYILKTMDGKLPQLFKNLPKTPYGIKKVPSTIAPKMPTAYYMPAPGDGNGAGFYFINTYDLKSRPLYELEALSLHEAVPGHHLQIALQQELTNLPKFRRFSRFLGFLEGWALYSEKLGKEVGLYQDPYSDFGRLMLEMWRACRLVVDTGLHYFGWSRQQAIDYLTKNSSLSKHNIETEVDRYISLPGQAVSYKMGEIKVSYLRKLAETELGQKFDIRSFHDVLLRNGAIPLDILEKNVKEYITKEKEQKAV